MRSRRRLEKYVSAISFNVLVLINSAIPCCATRPFRFKVNAILPVNGHCPNNRFCATLSLVGSCRNVCSAMSENPMSNPPQAANTTSMATYIIMSLVGILTADVRRLLDSTVRGFGYHWRICGGRIVVTFTENGGINE